MSFSKHSFHVPGEKTCLVGKSFRARLQIWYVNLRGRSTGMQRAVELVIFKGELVTLEQKGCAFVVKLGIASALNSLFQLLGLVIL